jgi:hypothetical protein
MNVYEGIDTWSKQVGTALTVLLAHNERKRVKDPTEIEGDLVEDWRPAKIDHPVIERG